MDTTILNICYEFAEDVMFSQDVSKNGLPQKIIIYVEKKYLKEVSKFLTNYDYDISSTKEMGRYFVLVNFSLTRNTNYIKKKIKGDI